jgi:DNA-binding MarR family transcriptional regulator
MNDDREALRAWLALLAASGRLKKSVDGLFRSRFGLSIARFDVLAALDRAGPRGLRAGALTERLMVSDGNTTQVTAPLIRDGLVRRDPDPEDRRAAIFTLTRKGERVFAEMAAEHRALIADAFAGLSETQMRSLRRLLSRLPTDGLAARKDAA